MKSAFIAPHMREGGWDTFNQAFVKDTARLGSPCCSKLHSRRMSVSVAAMSDSRFVWVFKWHPKWRHVALRDLFVELVVVVFFCFFFSSFFFERLKQSYWVWTLQLRLPLENPNKANTNTLINSATPPWHLAGAFIIIRRSVTWLLLLYVKP